MSQGQKSPAARTSPGQKKQSSRNLTRLRYLVRQLSGPGSARWVHVGYRLLLLLSAAFLIDLAFPVQSAPDLPVLQEGLVAGEDVIATIPFPVYKSEAELTRERAEAAGAEPPIFDYHPQMADSSIARATAFLNTVGAAASSGGGDIERKAAMSEVLKQYRIPASENRLALLMSGELRGQLAAAMEKAFDEELRPGVVSSGDLGTAGTGGVILRVGGEQDLVSRDLLTTMQQFYERAAEYAPSEFGVPEYNLYRFLVIRFANASIELNRGATDAIRNQARLAVDPVKYEVLENERVVAANERVGREEIEKLRALEAAQTQQGGGHTWGGQIGGVFYNLLLLVIFGLVLRYFRPRIYESSRSLGLLWVLVLAVAGAAALISWAGWPPLLIPVAFAALIVATLYDGLLALVMVFVVMAIAASRPPLTGMTVLFPVIMGGAAAALSGRVVRRRAHTWTFAAVIAAAYVLAAISLGLIRGLDFGWVATASGWGTVNAVLSALLATGILPLAESFTRITTDQTLLELADLNRPLLRRLSLEAPGTYAHSINVANLAEAAAREIGANSLLVRVGVYYHDIGKVKKPQYFVENQPRGRNPHDKLKPVTSAGIVREHVKEGLELAGEARLPDAVKVFIPEHHGTQQIGFFLDKAKELDPDAGFDLADFRYRGPRPQSKETAIALLADSVESAARVLHDPTHENIVELVDRIVDYKMSEHQLDEAPLTLREITVVKEQFVKVLSGMYHSRLDYPPQNNQTAKVEEPAAHQMP
jgi:cyclic-di-AMP phosphodiesterase PgpH